MNNYPTFTTPERRNVSMQDARLQANDELGSLYERALQNIQTSVADRNTSRTSSKRDGELGFITRCDE